MSNKFGLHRFNIFAPYRKILRKAKAISFQVENLKPTYANLTNEELSKKTEYFINQLNKNSTLDSLLPDVFATAREAIYRVTGIFAFPEQIVGAYILHIGDFAELYTGEGKTIVCIMAAYANSFLKQGIHIITVNEYLVERDAKYCAQCLNPLGVTVGYNLASFDRAKKKEMFACDITYTTHSELGFDYLRDNMVGKYDDKVLRDLNFAIIDEGDSVLIDEARTPLIISGMPKKDTSLYFDADKFAKTLKPENYKIDLESNTISLTDSGVKKAEEFFKLKNYYLVENSNLIHKIKNALMANFIFEEGKEYIVRNGKIILVDQHTGRILEGRSYNAGLHQAIQAKEYVTIEPENVTVATITYQSFFRMYKKIAGCSGTALTEQEEFLKIYNMIVVPVPTHKPVIRKDYNDYIFFDKVSKWHHVVSEIETVNKTGQPILVGTASVEDSEQLANFLTNKGIKFELLNAKNNLKEADIVKNAGQKFAITISTNMAGRGTDIKLGEGVTELGGLYVIGTEHSESRRVDNQLRGRSGRQGDVGKTRFFISLQDDLLHRFLGNKYSKATEKMGEDYIDSRFFTAIVNHCQKRVEGFNFDMRKNLIDYDSVLSNQRELIYRQRDDILLGKNVNKILHNMCKTIGKEIAKTNIDPKNGVFVISDNVTSILNKVFFNKEIIYHNYFKNKSVDDSAEVISDILQMSVDVRLGILGQEQSEKVIKDILIQNLDYFWTSHLDTVTKIREGVSLRSLEQKSPLNIYVEEADKYFNEMKVNIARNAIVSLHRFFIPDALEKLQLTFSKSMANVLCPDILDSLGTKATVDNFSKKENIVVKKIKIKETSK